MADKEPSLAVRLRRMGLPKSTAYMLAWKERTPKLPLAIRIYDELGEKMGPLANATDEQIDVLREMQEASR